MSNESSTFSVQIDDGPEQEITVASGYYISAAAAVPAILGIEDFPIVVKIWVPRFQPDHPPLYFRIKEAGGAPLQVVPVRDFADQSMM